jgi:TolB-like protein/Tfp pilus assembly protein PilF
MSRVRTVRGRGYFFDLDGAERTIKSTSEQIDVLRVVVVDEEKEDAGRELARRVTRRSAGDYLLSAIKQHRLAFIATAITLATVAIVLVVYFRGRSPDAAIQSIAVLPFVNASGNGDVEYLSDGMTDVLITSLSQLPQLSVKARSSVFRYKGKDTSPQQVGRELNVQAILSGRLVQRGDAVTLHIELVDVQKETVLWSADYSRAITNLSSLQGEIARDVSDNLRLRLTGTEQQRMAKRDTPNPEAYRAYLKGRYYWYQSPAPGFEKSRDYFQQAIDLDANYARAYAGLADYYGFASAVGPLPPGEGWPKAEAAANKALALDETLAEAYNPLAAIKLYYYRDWPAAERAFRRGLQLNPNFVELYIHYGISLAHFGRGQEGLAAMQRAIDLDPLSVRAHGFYARIFFTLREYDRAINQYQNALGLEPNFVIAHEGLGDAYEQKGMQKDAVAEWSKALSLSGAPEQASVLERAYATAGFEAAVRTLAKQQIERLNQKVKRGDYVPAFEYVTAYTREGDNDQALAWLDKAVQERNGFVFAVRVNPIYARLRTDPRFQPTLERAGL